MHLGNFENFTDCYISLIREVMHSPAYESAPRDQKIREILAASFTIEDPRARIPYVFGRKFSVSYMVAELVWYLSGDDKTSWISNYSGFWRDISDDGTTANSAYGARLFRNHDKIAQGRFNQLDYVLEELRRDPDSRRAVMHLRVPDDSIDARLDVPCTLALQFFIRDDKLHQIAIMRSSDLIFGIAYDIPAFTFFQEMIANELGVGLGSYTHMSNSLHIYERHFSMVSSILSEENVALSLKKQQELGGMPPARLGKNEVFCSIANLVLLEEKLQKSETVNEVSGALASDSKHGLFRDWAKVLASARLRKLGYKKEAGDVLGSVEFAGYNFAKRRNRS